MPWKEERDLRKAIYDSLREQHMMASHNQRSVSRQSTFRSKKASLPAGKPRKTALRVGESTKVDKAKVCSPSFNLFYSFFLLWKWLTIFDQDL